MNGGLQLVHLLLGCAEAIDASEYERAEDLLCHLRAISSPQGNPMQRIAFHFAEALSDHRRRHNNNNINMSNNMISIVTKPRIVILSGPQQTALVEMQRPLHAVGQQLQ